MKTSIKRMKAVNIEWDTDGNEDVILPSKIEIPEEMTDENEISDYLSDLTGYCHFGFELKEMSRIDIVKAYGNKEPERLNCEIIRLRPRIKELIDTANACLYNGIPIYAFYAKSREKNSKDKYTIGFTDPLGYIACDFNDIPSAYKMRINEYKTIAFHDGERDCDDDISNIISNVKYFVENFDKFEQEFYTYVDGIIDPSEPTEPKRLIDVDCYIEYLKELKSSAEKYHKYEEAANFEAEIQRILDFPSVNAGENNT